MMTVSACLWLGLFPLLQCGSYRTITENKWAIMLVLACFSLFCALRREKGGRTAGRIRERFFRPPVLFACGLALCILLSCAFSPYGADQWLPGASSRLEGLVSQLCYLGLFFLHAFGRIRRKPVLLSAAAGILAFFNIVMLQRAGVNALGLYPRAYSYANTPSFQGTIGNVDLDTGYLCLMAGLFLAELCRPGSFVRQLRTGEKGPARFLYPAAMTAALFIAVYLILSMGVQAGAVALAVLFPAVLLHFFPRKRRLPAVLLLLVTALAAVWFWPGQEGGMWELHEILHGRTQLSFGSNRIAVWKYSLMMAPQRLLTGSGPDTFEPRFNRFIEDNSLVIPASQGAVRLPVYFDNPHSEYLAHLLNHGLPAMILFIALIFSAVFFSTKKPAFPSVAEKPRMLSSWQAAALCYAVQALFSFSTPLVAPMFWVVLGLCVCDSSVTGP